MLADRHLHTAFSEDSTENPRNTIERAIELGMKDIYITDHYDIDFPGGIFLFDADKYFEELTRLKGEYKDRINLHIGVEVGLKEDIGGKLDGFLKSYPWEYAIGSIHLMDEKDPYYRDEFDMDDEEFYRLFFDTSLRALKACEGFDTFGHLDFAVRYGYHQDECYRYELYAEYIDEILKEVIRRDIALEINTAGLRKGLNYVHPYPDALRRYVQLGGRKLAIGSDAHVAKDVGANFKETLEYLRDFGFS